MKINFKNLLIKNTIIIVIVSLVIKVLSLLNRIILTRMLGNEGISIYILALPTIMLLLTIGGLSLKVTICKIVAENERTKVYSRNQILISSIKIGLIASLVISFVYVFLVGYISNDLLKQPNTFYPLLLAITIVPFVSINNSLRGFLNGLDKVNLASSLSLLEQIARISFTVIVLYCFKNTFISYKVSIAIIAMAIGEFISMLLGFIFIKKYLKPKDKFSNPTKTIFYTSLQLTLNQIIASVCFFLEPIIYTYCLSKINIDNELILYHYSEINAYAIPLLTMFMFISSSTSSVLMPHLAKNNNEHHKNEIIKKALVISLLPGIFFAILLTNYSNEYLQLLYNTNIGASIIEKFAFTFSLFYLTPVLVGILQAYNKQKNLLIISIINSFIHLILLFSLSYIPSITYLSLMYSYIITNLILTIVLYIYVKKITHFKIKIKVITKLAFLLFFTSLLIYVFKCLNINYLVSSIITFIVYIILILLLK